MIDRIIGKNCTGCTACKSICPKGAIEMRADSEGFRYPSVDYKECVQCKGCTKICPILNKAVTQYDEPEVYAAWNKDIEVRMNSTSGGVFSALAKAVIERGGYVVGAEYGDNFEIHHTIIHEISGIEQLRQSKYAQSSINEIFIEVKRLLQKGELVLFCGTPCQSAGLQQFLQGKYEKLYCCDFICRGVISPKVYQKYLDDKARGKRDKLIKVHFKNKDYGWNRFSTKLSFSDGSSYQQDRYHDSYLQGYLNYNLYLRPSCHECRYKELPRRSDMSLGDFWGIGKYKKELDTDQGTSVVLVNSDKGRKMFEWMKEQLYISNRSIEEVIAGNACLLNVAPKGEYREFFFANIDKMSFDTLIRKIEDKVMQITVKDRILRFVHLTKLKLCGK